MTPHLAAELSMLFAICMLALWVVALLLEQRRNTNQLYHLQAKLDQSCGAQFDIVTGGQIKGTHCCRHPRVIQDEVSAMIRIRRLTKTDDIPASIVVKEIQRLMSTVEVRNDREKFALRRCLHACLAQFKLRDQDASPGLPQFTVASEMICQINDTLNPPTKEATFQ